MAEVTYNPFEPGFAEDPYPQYGRIRDATRTSYTVVGNRLIHRYDDCFALLRQPGTSVMDVNASVSQRVQIPSELLAGREDRGRHAILNLDPPDHTRIRRLVSSAFTMRRVEQLRPRVRQLVDTYLDDVDAAGADGEPVDLMEHFAFPLPFQVITELLGMPKADRDQLRRWSHTTTRILEPVIADDELSTILEASDSMNRHVREAIEWKRRNPADDLLSAMIAAEEDGERLSTAELIDQVVLLYLAGHETTVNLIGNGTVALLAHRDQFERLAADPELDANAVDEVLRWDSPVQLSRRIVLSEMEVGGEMAQPGDLVVTLLGAANRDPAKWGPTAERLDLARPGAGAHLSFGSGIHHCLGAALARLEGAEALGAVVRRFPQMELATDVPHWNGRVVLRGVDTLDVALAA
ncbi:MAG: cytochrome P450 [Acidimicrobiales bacterium]